MRITHATRFAHPVLNHLTDDFVTGEFDVRFVVEEKPATGALRVGHEIVLTEPAVRELIVNGDAVIGCFVRCNDTYVSELRELGWPKGLSDFPAGSLLNRVTLRPLVWLRQPLIGWDAGSIHPEFFPPVDLTPGALIAIGPEYVISVGQAKFAPLESIFDLSAVEDLPEGRIKIDAEADRVTIMVSPKLFDAINVLRGKTTGQATVLNAVYLPAVIELLDLLRADPAQFSGRRWYQPFVAKCDARGIVLSHQTPLLESAQVLLQDPARELIRVAAEDDS